MSFTSRARLTGGLLSVVLGASLATTAAPASAATPRDDGLLTFVRSNQVYTSTTTGTVVKKLTSAGKNYRPHWSPDGRRIAFVHEATAGVRDIWVMNANGSGKQQVTHLGDTTEPTWSPDGRWLAFGADGTSHSFWTGARLHKVRSTAPFGTPVTMPAGDVEPYVAGSLDWSPDGKRIAFASDSFPSSPDRYLLVYAVATRQIEVLGAVGGSCCGEGYLRDPAWTRDGKALALSQVLYRVDETPPAGSHLSVFGYPGGTAVTHPNVTGDADPDYSPTGTKVAFSHWSRIYTSAANGTHRTNVTQGYEPDWQPVLR